MITASEEFRAAKPKPRRTLLQEAAALDKAAAAIKAAYQAVPVLTTEHPSLAEDWVLLDDLLDRAGEAVKAALKKVADIV